MAPMIEQLSGATETIGFRDHDQVAAAILALTRCHRHHFALVNEQMAILMSPLAVKCLSAAMPRSVEMRNITLRSAVPETEYSPIFIEGMLNRMTVSFFKYGALAKAYPHDIDALASLRIRLGHYDADGNTEWLMDAANFAMVEFMRPRHPDAHYTPQDSDTSPGRVDNRGVNSDAPNGDRKWW